MRNALSALPGRARALGAGNHAALIAAVIAIGTFAALRSPVFLTADNLAEILRAASTYFIIACPVALLMITGGLDFSVGATFSVGAVVAGTLMTAGMAWPAAASLGVVAGGLAGLGGGALAVFFRVPPIIATLSVFFMATGLISVLVKGLIAPLPEGFLQIGQAELLGLSVLIWYAAAIGLITWVLLEKTRFGYQVRAIGGDREAAGACGIAVRRIDLTIYVMCGAGAALAGILYAARTSVVQPDAGSYLTTLQVITAVLVGGVSLSGGVGSIAGVALGTLLFSETQNALGVARIDQVWLDVFIGGVLALSVAIDGYRRRRRFAAEPEQPVSSRSVSRLELGRLISEPAAAEAARIAAAVGEERRRIERDLHDGAQQQLVNAALILKLASEGLRDAEDERLRELLGSSAERLDSALSELRDLSRGVYPVLLQRYGLERAIRSLARRSILPVEVEADYSARAPEQVELTAYFVVAEALTNALKHAAASSVKISLSNGGDMVEVTVSDDGDGDADPSSGSGLGGLRDRVTAIGGQLEISSPPGVGTTVSARIPAGAVVAT